MSGFARALLAVILGNLVYFLLMPRLPRFLRHTPGRPDWGLLLDFAVCALLYGLLHLVFAARKLPSTRN